MKVLVTGHKGYIGTVMVPMLQQAGHDVTGLAGFDTDLYEKCTFGDDFETIKSIRKDIRRAERKDMEGFDAVIHLAGLSNDPLGDLNPDLTYDINHLASVHLATIAKEAGVKRFLFSSSCSNYGAAGEDLIDETGQFNPVTPYGKSKVKAEQDISKLSDDKFCTVFFRSATAYGVSPRLRFDLVLNNLVAWAFTTGKVLIKSDGTPWRPIVHIEDISRAFIAALDAPEADVNNEAFNVGVVGENYRVSELADIVAETVPGCEIEYAKDAGPDKRCYKVDCSKLPRVIPAYKPQWNARKGAQQLYETFKAIGLKVDDFEGPRYKRIDHIKMLLESGKLDSSLFWSDDRYDK